MLEILVDKVGVAIATKCTTMMLIGRDATCMGPWHGSPLAGLAVSSSSSNLKLTAKSIWVLQTIHLPFAQLICTIFMVSSFENTTTNNDVSSRLSSKW